MTEIEKERERIAAIAQVLYDLAEIFERGYWACEHLPQVWPVFRDASAAILALRALLPDPDFD